MTGETMGRGRREGAQRSVDRLQVRVALEQLRELVHHYTGLADEGTERTLRENLVLGYAKGGAPLTGHEHVRSLLPGFPVAKSLEGSYRLLTGSLRKLGHRLRWPALRCVPRLDDHRRAVSALLPPTCIPGGRPAPL